VSVCYVFTALQAGLILADTLQQPEVFVNMSYVPSETRFSHYAKIKKHFHHSF